MEPITYTLQAIPSGKEGIRATLKIMGKLVKDYRRNRTVRELALHLVRHLQQKNFYGEVEAIHHFVKEKIRYVKDIKNVETLQSPLQTLRLKAGDCDDKSILVASLLESIGHPTRFLAVGFKANSLSHVFVQTKIGNKWVSVECTEPVALGWTPKNVKNIMIHNN